MYNEQTKVDVEFRSSLSQILALLTVFLLTVKDKFCMFKSAFTVG